MTTQTAKRSLSRLSPIEILLTGYPDEFLDVPCECPSRKEGDLTDRAMFVAVAERWLGVPSLTTEERDRIRKVWIDRVYEPRFIPLQHPVPAIHLTWQRREELMGLLQPRAYT